MVSTVGLGGNTFGRECDARATTAIVHRALDLGVNHFDCADIYSDDSAAERLLGAALKGRRHVVVLATKTGYPLGSGPNAQGLSRRRLIQSCENSLRRLDTDYIDLFYLHRPDPLTDIEETVATLDELVRQGKVRYIGCSNFSAWEIVRIAERSAAKGWAKPVVSQSLYNMLTRDAEHDLLPALASCGMGIVPYSPLAGGLLTGKYATGAGARQDVRSTRRGGFARLLQDDVRDVLARLTAFAQERDLTTGQLALAWLLDQPGVCSVIPGATDTHQAIENIMAADWTPNPEESRMLAEILTSTPRDLNTRV